MVETTTAKTKLLAVTPIAAIFSSGLVSAEVGESIIPLPIFTFLSLIVIALLMWSLSKSSLFPGIIAVSVMFMLGGVVEQGNLGFSSETIINESTGVTVVTDQWVGWSGEYNHLVGFLLQIFAIMMFVILLVGGGDDYS